MNQPQIQKVVRQITDRGLDAMLICPSPDMELLTGFSPMMCERFQGLFLTAGGERFYVCNLMYQEELAHALGDDVRIYPWTDGEEMTETVSRALSEYGLDGGTIGVNYTAQAFNVLDIMDRCGVRCVNGVALLEEARIIKSPEEIQALGRAAKIADDTFAQALERIKPGVAEGDILEFLLGHMQRLGGSNMWGTVASGPNSSYPHYNGTGRVLEEQDVVILDFGCTWQGLYSDMTRTVFVGGVTDEQRRVYSIVRKANEAGESAAINGAYIPHVDGAARNLIAHAGYGDNFVYRLGHGIGRMIHEAPYIHKGNRRTLEPGMAFSVEPGIYLSGRFGVRIEDIVVATKTGNEILNQATKDLIVL